MKRLQARIALVTGGSGGIGEGIVRRLSGEGATVVFTYGSNTRKAEAIAHELTAAGGAVYAEQADLTEVTQCETLAKKVAQRLGRIDLLINNAGTAVAAPVGEMTEADYQRVFDLNVKGALFVLQAASRHMDSGARIVNISSSTTAFPSSGMAIYAGSKAAVKTFTENIAVELGPQGILVNSVVPGPTVPGMFENAPQEHQDRAQTSSPLQRIGTPGDIAAVVAFLCSDDAGWMTGQHLLANGGATI
jgi:3-oxoacyl-[acyl-carrier protein] reductase